MRSTRVLAAIIALIASASVGCVSKADHDALAAKVAEQDAALKQSRADLERTRADLEATRQRLDNALRASADSSSDLIAEKQRINDLAGRLDESAHGVDELKRDLGATRTELYQRIDEIRRAQSATPATPAPAPIAVPAEKAAHSKAIDDAYAKKDWATVRALAPEYVNRYPTDDRADEALYFMGDADMQDGRPSAALGDFNRLLKLYPRSNVLDKTLYGMGEAYLAMHDCTNAKLAYDACEKRFPKEKTGIDSKAKLQTIAKNAQGLCAPGGF